MSLLNEKCLQLVVPLALKGSLILIITSNFYISLDSLLGFDTISYFTVKCFAQRFKFKKKLN